MNSTNWTWIGRGIPTIEDMKETASYLLSNVCDKEECYTSSTGGFTATKYEDHLKLEFVIAGLESIYLNFNDNYELDKQRKNRKDKLVKINDISS